MTDTNTTSNASATAGTRSGSRRAAVRRELATGTVASLRELADRLDGAGVEVTPEALRSDVRALGAIRVQHGEGTLLVLPADDGAARSPRTSARLAAEVSADPDWRIQVGVVAVVALFLLVGFAGWLLSL